MAKKTLVVLTGAGISAESGLRTFRDSDGLWEGHAIEEVATPEAWKNNPQRVLDFYNSRRRDVAQARPNAAHHKLAELEQWFDVQIITQNIDDLHERAGSTRVLHLHGQIFTMRSERNESLVSEIRGDIQLGQLAPDGGQYRPHIVWFHEPVPMIEPAVRLTRQANLFAVIGTSLAVYPAAGLLQEVAPGIPLFMLDKKIPYTAPGILTIEAPATEGVLQLEAALQPYR